MGCDEYILPTFDFAAFSPGLEVLSLKGYTIGNYSIGKTNYGDANLGALAKLIYLKELDLSNTMICPVQIEAIPSLQKLVLDNSFYGSYLDFQLSLPI